LGVGHASVPFREAEATAVGVFAVDEAVAVVVTAVVAVEVGCLIGRRHAAIGAA
jgi:hypothetical protein